MRISVIGSGYVGLVAGTCFGDSGNDVACADLGHEMLIPRFTFFGSGRR